MANIFDSLRELWQRLSINQRAMLIVGAGLLVAIGAGAVNYTTRPVLVTLYSGLETQDAATVADGLRDQKIPYEILSDGTIKVPQENVNELRLAFAEKGIPRSGELGYEIFDKPMLGMTDFLQKMNYHRAVEGELARTMQTIEGVEGARVHLVVPAQRLFKEDQKPTTASVILTLKPGYQLSKKQVAAIASLTAYSVEGLETEHVTIVDSEGNLLTAGPRDELAGLSSSQLEVQTQIESELEKKAEALLEDVVGAGRARVEVTAKLNWDRSERTIEDYDAERAATLSEESQASEDAEAGTSEKTVTNYYVPKTIEKVVPEVGNIERLWASVLIDGSYETATDAEGKTTRTFVERTPQEIEKFRSLVSGAIGLDIERSDEITVISFPFDNQEEQQPIQEPVGWLALLLQFADKIVIVVVLILAFFVLKGILSKVGSQLPALPAAQGVGALPAGVIHGAAQLPQGASAQQMYATAQQAQNAAAQVGAAMSGGSVSPMGQMTTVYEGGQPKVVFKSANDQPRLIELDDGAPTVEALKAQEMLNRTVNFVLTKPENATQIMRGWMLDGNS
ncbi:flagellar M-ring protein FliF [bacterium]|nr:flagellar M-ring protein FliF [bacterium]